MLDTVKVTRETLGEGSDENGNPVVDVVVLYEGVCRLVQRSSVVRDVDAQSQLIGVQTPELHVPVDGTGDIQKDDRFEITGSATDAQLVGVKGVVAGMFPSSQVTARRLPVEVWS